MAGHTTKTDIILIFSVLIFGGLIALLYFKPTIVTEPWSTVKRVELNTVDILLEQVFGERRSDIRTFNELDDALEGRGWSLGQLVDAEGHFYWYSSWLWPLLILIAGIYHYRNNIQDKYNTVHSLETLLVQETKIHRFNRHLINNDPFDDSSDITKGKYRIAEHPYPYCVKRGIIVERQGQPDMVNSVQVRKVMSSQLGPLLTGLESFSETERLIVAILLSALEVKIESEEQTKNSGIFGALKKKFRRRRAQKMKIGRNYAINGLSGDASYWLNGEMKKEQVFEQVDRILDLYWDCPLVEALAQKHAYVSTFIRRLYIEVKRDGTFQPAYLNWMKLLDRRLWFVLHSTGCPGDSEEWNPCENMPAGNAEVMMVIKQYTSERIADQAVPTPEFDLIQQDIEKMVQVRFDRASFG